jgi:hypothetical protein
MADDKVAVTELEQRMRAWIEDHTRTYLGSHGAEGHILDMEMLGGHKFTPTLLLPMSVANRALYATLR